MVCVPTVEAPILIIKPSLLQNERIVVYTYITNSKPPQADCRSAPALSVFLCFSLVSITLHDNVYKIICKYLNKFLKIFTIYLYKKRGYISMKLSTFLKMFARSLCKKFQQNSEKLITNCPNLCNLFLPKGTYNFCMWLFVKSFSQIEVNCHFML